MGWMMTQIEAELMRQLVADADERFGGQLTILKSTTDWRISFEAPSDRGGIAAMAAGTTFGNAARNALAAVGEGGC